MTKTQAVIKHEVPCPHPHCDGKIRVADGLPAGVYDCPCKSCQVRLSWSPYSDRSQPPRVTMADVKAQP